MSAAVAQQRRCIGCGHDLGAQRGRFCNGRCKKRYEAAQTFPKYLSAELRLEKCAKHGQEYEQRRFQFSDQGAARTGVLGTGGAAFSPAAAAYWSGDCPECKREDDQRIAELRKPKQVSACEARTCKCEPPKCRECGQPMKMGPGALGWHSWVCNDIGLAEDKKAETGIIAKPLVVVGTHKGREQWTAWRAN